MDQPPGHLSYSYCTRPQHHLLVLLGIAMMHDSEQSTMVAQDNIYTSIQQIPSNIFIHGQHAHTMQHLCPTHTRCTQHVVMCSVSCFLLPTICLCYGRQRLCRAAVSSSCGAGAATQLMHSGEHTAASHGSRNSSNKVLNQHPVIRMKTPSAQQVQLIATAQAD
jgi:hypothetical protein